jgi:hypothetical protein
MRLPDDGVFEACSRLRSFQLVALQTVSKKSFLVSLGHLACSVTKVLSALRSGRMS